MSLAKFEMDTVYKYTDKYEPRKKTLLLSIVLVG